MSVVGKEFSLSEVEALSPEPERQSVRRRLESHVAEWLLHETRGANCTDPVTLRHQQLALLERDDTRHQGPGSTLERIVRPSRVGRRRDIKQINELGLYRLGAIV